MRVGERERACERDRESEGEGKRGDLGSELRRDDASRLARPKTKVRPRLRGGVNGNQTGARKSTARQKAGGDLARQERRGGESRWSSVTQHTFRTALPCPSIFFVLHFRDPAYFLTALP